MADRRQFLRTSLHTSLQLLVINSGILSLLSARAAAELFGQVPVDMPLDQSIYRLTGQVWVDGEPATLKTQVQVNSLIQTGAGSEVVFVIGNDAHILRENSELQLSGSGKVETGLKVITGKILSVFGKRASADAVTLTTSTATIGIRGTGVYCESYADYSYVCNCYGEVALATTDGEENELTVSEHHDAPRYIYRQAKNGKRIVAAPLINHTDQELALVEALVGRTPPFANFLDSYQTPRRRY